MQNCPSNEDLSEDLLEERFHGYLLIVRRETVSPEGPGGIRSWHNEVYGPEGEEVPPDISRYLDIVTAKAKAVARARLHAEAVGLEISGEEHVWERSYAVPNQSRKRDNSCSDMELADV